jgi:hypothetical protein
MNTDKYVGLDVHKDTTVVAVAEGGREGECRIYGTISSDLHAPGTDPIESGRLSLDFTRPIPTGCTERRRPTPLGAGA